MASAIMHICVAKKVNEHLKMDENMLYLGTIAPDISKEIGQNKKKSHFLDNNLPDTNKFLKKYKKYLNNPFEMGYYIHLLTDYYWFKDFIQKKLKDIKMKLNNNTELKLNSADISKIIYSDYTNLNIRLIEHYDIALKLFYKKIEYPKTKINEIPINKLKIIVDKMGTIIKNSTNNKTIIMDLAEIYTFIDETSKQIVKIITEERSEIQK